MRKLIVSEWTSLDGVFDSALMEQWFNPYHSDSRAGYIQEVINNCEIMLYGRHTYEMLYPYWSQFHNNEMGVADKMNQVKKYVASTTMKNGGWQNTTIISDNIIGQLTALKQENGRAILVQGSGQLVATLLQADLVDELKLLVQPHIMGSGTRLLKEGANIPLELGSISELEKGVLALTYGPGKQ